MWKKSLALRNYLLCCLLSIVAPAVAGETSVRADLSEAGKAVRMHDYSRAFRAYSHAATRGSAEAQYQLANLYRLGQGVAPDPAQQRRWLERAATNGHPAAAYSLALIIQERETERARLLLQSAAAAGYQPADHYLQRMADPQVAEGNTQLPLRDRWFAAARKNRYESLALLHEQLADIDMSDAQQRTALSIGVQSGSAEAVAWLVAHGASPEHRDRFGRTAAFSAIDVGRYDLLNTLFSAPMDPNHVLPNGDSLLHYAIRRQRSDMLAGLLRHGTAINLANADGWTALDLAEFAGDQQALALLRQHGAGHGQGWYALNNDEDKSPNAKLASRWTAKQAADPGQLARIVSAGNVALLRKQLAGREQLLRQPLDDGRTLLAIAIINGQLAMVNALLDVGANPDDRVDRDSTALQWAAQNGQQEVVIALLDRGAQATLTNSKGMDAIEMALFGGHEQLAASMLVWLDNAGQPAPLDRYLLNAARADADQFVALIAPRVKQLSRDAQQRSALWFAASLGNSSMVDTLLSHRLLDDEPDSSGKTPLLVAAERGCIRCMHKLMKVADVNRQTPSGDTALMLAAGAGDRAMVTWLLTNGAKVDVRNALGDSALTCAVRANAVDIVRQLVQAGASVSRKNGIGLSAQDLAADKGADMLAALELH